MLAFQHGHGNAQSAPRWLRTYRFDAEVGGVLRGLILRRDPIGSLIDTDRQVEDLIETLQRISARP